MLYLNKYLIPEWPAPSNVFAYSTTRLGGFSKGAYHSFNLGKLTEDNPQSVTANRELLQQELKLPGEPFWIKQIHGTTVINAHGDSTLPEADASYTQEAKQVCLIMTADCLPILICNRAGTVVAAVHAGWRGLLAGVIENTISAMGLPGSELLAWLGPAIGPQIFEIGTDIRDQFLQKDPQAEVAFQDAATGKCLANIYLLAKLRLAKIDVNQVFGGTHCTYNEPELFYSHRRDKGITGRMASLIWFN